MYKTCIFASRRWNTSQSCTIMSNCWKSSSHNLVETEAETYYKRKLPESCVSFHSQKGKEFFKKSFNSGFMEIYFVLGQQLQTQHEPAYCGLTALVVVLNAFGVDPEKRWKGIWRWYHEENIRSCVDLISIQKNGIMMKELACIARCNNLKATVIEPSPQISIDVFRKDVMYSCKSGIHAIIVCFARDILDQTGKGHFAAIGGYNPENDTILILETARFKYPNYWVSLTLMWEAIKTLQDDGDGRGYIKLTAQRQNDIQAV